MPVDDGVSISTRTNSGDKIAITVQDDIYVLDARERDIVLSAFYPPATHSSHPASHGQL